MVERMSILVFRMCLFAVAIDFGRFFSTRSDVRPGQVAKKPASITWIYVDGTGLKVAWWR